MFRNNLNNQVGNHYSYENSKNKIKTKYTYFHSVDEEIAKDKIHKLISQVSILDNIHSNMFINKVISNSFIIEKLSKKHNILICKLLPINKNLLFF